MSKINKTLYNWFYARQEMSLSISQKRMWVVLIVAQVLLLWTFISLKPIYAVGVILGIGCLLYLLLGSDQLPKSILLTILISGVLLEGERRFLIKIEEIPIFFVVGFFVFNRLLGDKSDGKIGPTGKWLTAFLFVVALSTVIGIQRGRGFREVGGEFVLYFYYLLFFLVIGANLSERWIKYIIYGIIGVAVAVTLEYMLIYRATGGAQRTATDQQHMLNIGIPLVFSWLLYEKRVWIKVLLSLLLIPMVFAVLITLTRMIWVSVPISLLFILFLYLWRERVAVKHFLYAGVSVAVVIMFLILPVKELMTGQVNLQHTVKSRFASLTQLRTDISLAGRVELASYVLPKIKRCPVLGSGLGDMVYYKFMSAGMSIVSFHKGILSHEFIATRGANIHWLDSTYLHLLWKTGIVGLFLLIGLYAVFMKRCWFVFKNAGNDFEKWSSMGIFVSFTALLAISFLSAILVGYRFNLTWAALMGIIELQAQRIETKSKSELR